MSTPGTQALTHQLQQLGKACKEGLTLHTLKDLVVLLLDHSLQQTQLLSFIYDVATDAVTALQVCCDLPPDSWRETKQTESICSCC